MNFTFVTKLIPSQIHYFPESYERRFFYHFLHIDECSSASCLLPYWPVYGAPLRLSVLFPLLTHTHPEDGNDNVPRNVEAASTHDVASPQKPKLYDSMYLLLSSRKRCVVHDKSIYSHNKHINQINRSLYLPT